MDSEGGTLTSRSIQTTSDSNSNNHRRIKDEHYQIQKIPNHRYYNLIRSLLFIATFTLTCLVLNRASQSPFEFLAQSFSSISPVNAGDMELKQVLERAAMKDKTVIITTLNEAWIESDSIFDLFIESFVIGNDTFRLLRHLLVVSLDEKAFDHCEDLRLNCYFLKTKGIDFSVEAHFRTTVYLKMMWRRIDFLRSVLELGYNFVFTDADIMWFRNPFPHLYSDTNFQIACDSYRGNPYDLKNSPNGGFAYARSSKQTIDFYKFWYKSRERYPNKHDQDVLNHIKYSPFIKKIGLKIKFLDTAYFGGFCSPSKDLNMVCTMHANCCAGLDNKIYDLKILLKDWNKYLSLPDVVRESQPPSWTVPKRCGPSSFRRHNPRKRKNKTRKQGEKMFA